MNPASLAQAYRDNRVQSLHDTAAEYHRKFGWRPVVVGSQVLMALDESMIGLRIPSAWAGEVNHRLRPWSSGHAVICMPGPRPQWVFLTVRNQELPHCVNAPWLTVLPTGYALPLPPSRLPEGPVRWVVAPEEGGTPAYLSHVIVALRSVIGA